MLTYPAPPDITTVILRSDEVTTMCPVMGNPDYYTVELEYEPAGRVLCTKALKEWFTDHRQAGFSCETFAQAVLDAVFAAVKPCWLVVRVTQKPRGGVGIVAETARWADTATRENR